MKRARQNVAAFIEIAFKLYTAYNLIILHILENGNHRESGAVHPHTYLMHRFGVLKKTVRIELIASRFDIIAFR